MSDEPVSADELVKWLLSVQHYDDATEVCHRAAAEITRLRAQVEAADGLAALLPEVLETALKNNDLAQNEYSSTDEDDARFAAERDAIEAVDAALATYQQAKEGRE